MPLPTVLCLALATGVVTAWAGRDELRVSSRPALLTRASVAYVFFAAFVLVPTSAYFYVFHGDWFVLYLFDTSRVPSALALVALVLEGGLGVAGFFLGAHLVRAQRTPWVWGLLGASFAGAALPLVVASRRVAWVGTYGQFHGSFGLEAYLDAPVLPGAIVMGGLLLAGQVHLLLRLHFAGRSRS